MANPNFTKQVMFNAFKSLLETRQFSDINISDICQQSKLSRNSFYYHFKDKYDLVNCIFDTEFASVLKSRGDGCEDIWIFMKNLADYFYSNQEFYRKTLCLHGQNSFAEHFREYVRPAVLGQLQNHSGNDQDYDFQQNLATQIILLAFQMWITGKECVTSEAFIARFKCCIQCFTGCSKHGSCC